MSAMTIPSNGTGCTAHPRSALGQNPNLPRRSIAVRFYKQTPTGWVRCDAMCRFCCKSPKLPGANFSAVEKFDRRPPFDVASITLPRSPASLSSGDEVPHIFTRNSRVQPKEILITSAKRLLQQNLPKPDSCTAANSPLIRSLRRRAAGAIRGSLGRAPWRSSD